MFCCVIPSHIEHPHRALLLEAAVRSVVDQADQVVVSVSGLPAPALDRRVVVVRHSTQQSQFQHIEHGLNRLDPRATHVLLLDDDDVASPALVATYKANTDQTVAWVPGRYRVSCPPQREPDLSFDQLVAEYAQTPGALSPENEISGTVAPLDFLRRFLTQAGHMLRVPVLDKAYVAAVEKEGVCDPAPLIWQREWRLPGEPAAWRAIPRSTWFDRQRLESGPAKDQPA